MAKRPPLETQIQCVSSVHKKSEQVGSVKQACRGASGGRVEVVAIASLALSCYHIRATFMMLEAPGFSQDR